MVIEQLPKPASRQPGPGELFQLLRDGAPRTRAELASVTGQARSTVATRIDMLMAAGLIVTVGEAHSTGGRPPAVFAFSPESRVVLAVDLGATHARMALTDLASNIIADSEDKLPIDLGPDAVLAWVCTKGDEMLAASNRGRRELVSVGVGLPGPVEFSSGRPINPPIMPGWDDADVAGRLGAHFDAPVLVDNDVNIMALGEHRSEWPEVSDLLFVKVATGIGSGIIADGSLRRGARGAAGDIGHIAVPGAESIPCRCGNLGCLEAVAGSDAIARRLREGGIEVAGSGQIVALVRSGDLSAARALRQAGRDVGTVLAACVSMLNPSMIVIGGSIAEAGEQLMAGIREVVYSRSLPLATQHLRVVASRARGDAAILGASALAIDHVLSADAIDAALA
ncbi:sugar kinase [Pseudoclavibacter sp. RFBI5]|uniref:ROK family transcriptional regulator n=1 Tax=Pseudoclavibacter sp. RFBI5 TaxID=2080578 RepID=UPI000CE846D4|nr:ROK family transcriptional regulator [Pseudoclavibacter sp. RFBI5]PPG05554.1 sugar kinase [Pseudoclavibacter sp. RFBI5]